MSIRFLLDYHCLWFYKRIALCNYSLLRTLTLVLETRHAIDDLLQFMICIIIIVSLVLSGEKLTLVFKITVIINFFSYFLF